MREFLKGLYFGANITGGGGKVACDDLNNDLHYILSEVSVRGAVTKDTEKRFNRLTVTDYKKIGVEVHLGVNDNPIVKPGEQLQVKVGLNKLTIEGTDSRGVLLNGAKPTKATPQNERIRYPHTFAKRT